MSAFGENWQTKYERVWRAFVELRQVVEDTRTNDPIDARDAMTRFCLHAFELRDWIVASPDVDQAAKDAIRQLFGRPGRVAAQSVALAACADIANRSKHLELDRPSFSVGGHADVTYESMSDIRDLPDFAIAMLPDLQIPRFGDHQWMWIITAGGTEYDALLLAEDAMKDWEQCLLGSGLLSEPWS